MNLSDLKQVRASKLKAQEDFLAGVGEGVALTDDQQDRFDALQKDFDAANKAVENAERMAQNKRIAVLGAGEVVGSSEQKEKNEMNKRYSFHKALRSQLPGGNLDGVEAEYHQEAVKEAKRFGGTVEGVAIPNNKRAAQQSVKSDSGNFGGNLVFEEFKGFIDALTPKPIVETLGAKYMRGLTGPAAFVTNGGGIVASWEGELDTVGGSKNAYGKKSMDAKRLSATVGVSVQNLHQSVIDLEMQTASDIRSAVERAIDLAVINGPGTGNAPLGILNIPGVNTISAGTNGAAPTWKQLVEMVAKIEDANVTGANLSYLINALTKSFLKSTLHTAGDSKYLMSEANSISGLRAAVSSFMPKDLTKGSGTNLSAAICGDFSEVLIGEWGYSDMVVDNITGKKSGIIEITANNYVDVLIKQEKAFTVIKDWKLS